MVAVDESTGEVFTTKTPTTVLDPSIGVIESIRKVLVIAGGGRVASVSHGTTVATNALLQEEFPALGLVTTEGFRHVLEIARQAVPKGLRQLTTPTRSASATAIATCAKRPSAVTSSNG